MNICKVNIFSEVKTNFRTAITIPEKSWCKWESSLILIFSGNFKIKKVMSFFLENRFRDIFDDYVIGMKEAVEAEEGAKDK